MQQIPIPASNITICSLPEDFTTGDFQVNANIAVITPSIINVMLAMHTEVIDHPLLKSKRRTSTGTQSVLPESGLLPQ